MLKRCSEHIFALSLKMDQKFHKAEGIVKASASKPRVRHRKKTVFKTSQVHMSTDAKGISNEAHFSDTLFTSLKLNANTEKAITNVFKYEKMTKVQEATYQTVMNGQDVLAKAKTGTGKTVGFLLPSLELLLKNSKFNTKGVKILVLSPTRELAYQIKEEATGLTTFLDTKVVCCVGGVNIKKDINAMRKNQRLDILVATPGRLQDHLNQDTENITARLKDLDILVLDEADRLLDMGFRKEISQIISYLPSARQTLLFSATMPESVESISSIALKKDYQFINTVEEGDEQTNAHVEQGFVQCTLATQLLSMEYLLHQHMTNTPNFKVIVFFNTANTAAYVAELLRQANFPIVEMHSRKSQSYRTKAADQFRKNTNVIMVSSDVSARGVDYPNVTFVLQVGLTDREQYIHRLGRTGRSGKQGQGTLLLCDFEMNFLRKDLSDMPLTQFSVPHLDANSPVSHLLNGVHANPPLQKAACKSYQAFLGYYNSNMRRLKLDKPRTVKLAEDYTYAMGLQGLPVLEARTVRKMGLQGVPGLNIQKNQNNNPSRNRH